MPLRDRTPGRRQHVGPVSQLSTGGVVAQHHFADGLRRANTVVIHHRHDQVDFLRYKQIRSMNGQYLKNIFINN